MRGHIKIWSAPSPNAFPARSWKSIYWRTFTDCWLVFVQEKGFPRRQWCCRPSWPSGSPLIDEIGTTKYIHLTSSKSSIRKEIKKLITRAYLLIVDMVYCRRKMYLNGKWPCFCWPPWPGSRLWTLEGETETSLRCPGMRLDLHGIFT